jgi:hypothetical protein
MGATIDKPNDDARQEALARIADSVFATRRERWALSDEYLHPEAMISVGLGYAALTRDGTPLYEQEELELETGMTVRQAEAIARLDPVREWRIHLIGLLDDRHYRRVGDGRWRLYRRGYGLS